MSPFERLEAWARCHRLVLEVYAVTTTWPVHERYGLTSQARRAAVSAAADIAEGSAKRGRREFRRYLDISLGSLAELEYLLRLASDLHYLAESDYLRVRHCRQSAGRTTWRLYEAIRE